MSLCTWRDFYWQNRTIDWRSHLTRISRWKSAIMKNRRPKRWRNIKTLLRHSSKEDVSDVGGEGSKEESLVSEDDVGDVGNVGFSKPNHQQIVATKWVKQLLQEHKKYINTDNFDFIFSHYPPSYSRAYTAYIAYIRFGSGPRSNNDCSHDQTYLPYTSPLWYFCLWELQIKGRQMVYARTSM